MDNRETSITQPPAIRKRPESKIQNAPQVNFDELFSHYKHNGLQDELGLNVKNLDERLFAKFVNHHPLDIARAEREGYIPIEKVKTTLGDAGDGVFVSENGDACKVYVCLKDHRDMRMKDWEERAERMNKSVFEKDDELPYGGDRKHNPPHNYIANT